jgi:DNA polymerase III epsilon subunit-like protein
MTLIVYDTETTSLLAASASGQENQPHIIEFAALKYNLQFERIDKLHLFLNPRVPITEEITKITGYTDELVRDKKPFTAHWREIATFFLGSTMSVGHNIMFDKMVLAYELERIGKVTNFPWPAQDVCTADTIQKKLGHRLNLTDLHTDLFGQGFSGAHGAMNDALATANCYIEMVKRGMT